MKFETKRIAKVVANGLKKVLAAEANSNSSFLAYQPKAPKALDQYKK